MRFGRRALDRKLVESTWKSCLEDEERLPDEWVKLKGVLVGILRMGPHGHVQ